MHLTPSLVSLITFLVFDASIYTGVLGQSSTCSNFTLTVDVSVDAQEINFPTPQNQSQFTGLVQDLFSATSNISELIVGTTPIQRSYEIFSSLCVPRNFKNGGVIEFAVHGINLDHTYWELGGSGSEFNYVDSALSAGHAIFIFDRLGTGLSSTPDGIKEVQTNVHVAVLTGLISKIRNGMMGHTFGPIVAVGHSYGSFLLLALAAQKGNIVDGLVLQGFSTSPNAFSAVFAGLGLDIANEISSTRFGKLSNSYAGIVSIVNMQQIFFHFPDFPQSLINSMFANRGVFTVGELITIEGILGDIATNFTGPILVATGAKDFIVCGGNCFQSVNGSSNLIESSQAFFPAASNFTIFIPANAGHCSIAHFGAPEILSTIEQWVTQHFS